MTNRDAVAEEIAQAFHGEYERLAPDFGYRTREASAKPWADVPPENRALMVATVGALLDAGLISQPELSARLAITGSYRAGLKHGEESAEARARANA